MTQPTHREPIRFLVVSASLRHDALNTRLASLAAECIRAHDGEVDFASMANFDCPSYNQDIQDSQGFPEGAVEFKGRLRASDMPPPVDFTAPEDADKSEDGSGSPT